MKEKLQCDNCGGVLDNEHDDMFGCKYCGMKYKITGLVEHRTFSDFVNKIEQECAINRIIVKPSEYTVISAKVEVSDDCRHLYPEEEINESVKKALVNQISDYIYHNFDDIVTMYSNTDIFEMKTVYYTRMKIPKERR